ncbi:MAG TPA: transglycosylase SLT domain-containing protein [Ktedonobacterales bacterium]|nr:transglycosylase SLT domain-containing protein [Ktedonobacterales bacterium]
MQLLTLRQNRFVRSLGVMRSGLLLAGVLGLALVSSQIGAAPRAHAASNTATAPWLYFQRGYYVDNGWLCYGWNDGAYHCTHHWYRNGNGKLVSTNTKWVPNYGATHTAPVTHRSAPVSHTPTYTPPSGSGWSGSVQGEIRAVFGPNAGAALAIAACESSYNPGAYNRSSGASGVFQFLRSTWATTSYAGYSPFNAWANIHAAYQVFQRDGYSWREWQCQP